MDVLLFDKVSLTRGGHRVDCSAEEFLLLPLPVRTGHILQGDLQFFRGNTVVDPARALASLRALSAETEKLRVLALSDEPDFGDSVAALEAAGYYVVVVSLLTDLFDAVRSYQPAAVLVNLSTAVLDESQLMGFIGGQSRAVVFLSPKAAPPRDGFSYVAPGTPLPLVTEVAAALRRVGRVPPA